MVKVNNSLIVVGGTDEGGSSTCGGDMLCLDNLLWTRVFNYTSELSDYDWPDLDYGCGWGPYALFSASKRCGDRRRWHRWRHHAILLLDTNTKKTTWLCSYCCRLTYNVCTSFFIDFKSQDILHLIPSSFYQSRQPPLVPCPLINYLKSALNSRSLSTVTLQYPSKPQYFNPLFIAVRGVEAKMFLDFFDFYGGERLTEEVPCEAMEALLYYFYCDQLKPSSLELIETVMIASVKFNVRGLMLLCEVAMGQGGEVKSSCLNLLEDYKTFASTLTQESPHPHLEPDFKVVCKGTIFWCHSTLLCLRSGFFKILFSGDFLPSDSVSLDDLNENTVLGVLRYMYSDDEGCLSMKLGEVSSLAKYWEVEDLVIKCETKLIHSISPEKFGEMFELGVELNLEHLVNFLTDLFKQNKEDFIKQKSYRKFAMKFPEIDRSLKSLAFVWEDSDPYNFDSADALFNFPLPVGFSQENFSFKADVSDTFSLKKNTQDSQIPPPPLMKGKSLQFEESYSNPFACLQESSEDEESYS